jgi:hypothetical protein
MFYCKSCLARVGRRGWATGLGDGVGRRVGRRGWATVLLGRWCCHNRCFYKVLGQWCCQNRCFYKVLGRRCRHNLCSYKVLGMRCRQNRCFYKVLGRGVVRTIFCQGFGEVVLPETVSILGHLLHFASWGPGGWATGWATGWAATLRYATLSITYSIYIYICIYGRVRFGFVQIPIRKKTVTCQKKCPATSQPAKQPASQPNS